MVDTLVVIYLCGWLPVTFAAYAASKRLADKRSPASRPLFVSLIAGGLWPVLVVGMVELSIRGLPFGGTHGSIGPTPRPSQGPKGWIHSLPLLSEVRPHYGP